MGLHYGLSSHLHPYYMFASSEGIERVTDQPVPEQSRDYILLAQEAVFIGRKFVEIDQVTTVLITILIKT